MKVVINFFWFLWRRIKNRNMEHMIVPKEVQESRYNTCMNCPLLNTQGILAKIKGPRCSRCGCFVKYKSMYSFEQCPDDPPRWKEYLKDAN